jgi:hypothetical protein
MLSLSKHEDRAVAGASAVLAPKLPWRQAQDEETGGGSSKAFLMLSLSKHEDRATAGASAVLALRQAQDEEGEVWRQSKPSSC